MKYYSGNRYLSVPKKCYESYTYFITSLPHFKTGPLTSFSVDFSSHSYLDKG